jgi:hypothetical protein
MAGHGGRVGGLLENSVIWRSSSTAITPKAVASMRGTSMQPTVQPRPRSAWSFTMSE